MTIVMSIVLIAIGLFLIWRVFKFAKKFQAVEDPPEEVWPGDVDVREPVPRRPKGRAGAIAMAEPEDDFDIDAYSRR